MRTKKCFSCPDSIKGLCCYHSLLIRTPFQVYNIVLTNHPCIFLDTDTNECTIYERRYELNPYCNTVEEAIAKNALPKECVYLNGTHRETIPKQPFIPDDLPKWIFERVEELNNLPKKRIVEIYQPELKKYF